MASSSFLLPWTSVPFVMPPCRRAPPWSCHHCQCWGRYSSVGEFSARKFGTSYVHRAWLGGHLLETYAFVLPWWFSGGRLFFGLPTCSVQMSHASLYWEAYLRFCRWGMQIRQASITRSLSDSSHPLKSVSGSSVSGSPVAHSEKMYWLSV